MGRSSKWTAAFKAKVAMEALKEQQSVGELAKRFEIVPGKVTEECIWAYGAPEIVNSDQGSQYTTQRWEDLLTEHGIKKFNKYYNYRRPPSNLTTS